MSDHDINDPGGGGMTAAAEYVLGVLGAEERRALENRMAQDPALAREVAFWEAKLGTLATDVPSVLPPAAVWGRIDTALRPTSAAQPRSGLWTRVGFWRGLAIGSSALAVASVAALIVVALPPAPRTPLVASLGADGRQPAFLAAVTPGGTSLMVVPAALTSVDQRALELWLIPAGEHPYSLGLIEPGRPVRVNVPNELVSRMRTDAVLAVSVEPPGGSPTGLPTGPVIATGKLATL